MKKLPTMVFAALLLLAFVLSAGCVAFSSHTSDILIGDQKVGSIVITPNQSTTLSSNASLSDKFDAEIELFGLKYTKNGITENESDSIYDTLTSKTLALANVSELLSGFQPKTASENASSAGEDFFKKLLNMPISAQNNATLQEAFDPESIDDNINNAVQQLEDFLSGIV